jgi:hypothetical protein
VHFHTLFQELIHGAYLKGIPDRLRRKMTSYKTENLIDGYGLNFLQFLVKYFHTDFVTLFNS